ITALSTYAAPLVAERLGDLRTMVLTHLISNVFLILIPLVGSLEAALVFLFLRQSVSQMDVPTRQTLMVKIFKPQDRVPANAITNTARSFASIFGAPTTGAMLSDGFASLPLLTGGIVKIAYDLAIFFLYRKRTR
ncbi:MAG TPA: MFS transporter, partial [Nitrososphaerales archaeon]|nr:MFS transporter [Nitrososphaerales archaeon]